MIIFSIYNISIAINDSYFDCEPHDAQLFVLYKMYSKLEIINNIQSNEN